jgi:hypothetical protein
MSKYESLAKHLARSNAPELVMTFAQLEEILGAPLPASARTHRPWWANSARGHVQSKGWLSAGYQSEQVDLEGEQLIFKKVQDVQIRATPGDQPNAGRHPLIGCMAGKVRLDPNYDYTAPTAPDWEDQLLEKFDRLLGQRK